MRRVVAHYRVCKQKESGACVVCKQLLALCCYHAKQCEEATCSVPFCLAIRQNLQRRRFQESASMKRRVAQMGVGVGTAFNHGHANLSGADDRQTSKGRFEAESASIMTHNTSKGVCFKARERGSESNDHMKVESNFSRADEKRSEKGEGIQQASLITRRQEESLVMREKVQEEKSGKPRSLPSESNSRGKLTKSFLQLLQAGDSPQDQRRQVMEIFQSNPQLLKDYFKSRDPRHLQAPAQHQAFQERSEYKSLPLPWRDGGVWPTSNFNAQQQTRVPQPVWFPQQQLVRGQLELLPASLVKPQVGGEMLHQQPARLQQHHQSVGGAHLEGQESVRMTPKNLPQDSFQSFVMENPEQR